MVQGRGSVEFDQGVRTVRIISSQPSGYNTIFTPNSFRVRKPKIISG
jgi:hypothetical protein